MAYHPKKAYISAIYDVSGADAGTAGQTITPVDTQKLPDNAVVTDVSIFAETAFVGSGGTLTVNAGGVDVTAAIAVGDLGDEAVIFDSTGGKATSGAEIKAKTHASNAFTAGKAHIIVGYFQFGDLS